MSELQAIQKSNSHNGQVQARRSELQDRTQAFCSAFLDLKNNPPEKILEEHFATANPKITEHGPHWASKRLPFLGKTFTGREECIRYFNLLAGTLEFQPNEDTFPGREGIVVDVSARGCSDEESLSGVVSVVGQARFKAVKSEESWEERFIYRLTEFDEDGKIGHWEIWADPLSAWVAVGEGGGEQKG